MRSRNDPDNPHIQISGELHEFHQRQQNKAYSNAGSGREVAFFEVNSVTDSRYYPLMLSSSTDELLDEPLQKLRS
jgi:hypothetical protein